MKRNYVLVPRNEGQEMNVFKTLKAVTVEDAFLVARHDAATIQALYPEADITCAIYHEEDYLNGKEPRTIAYSNGEFVNL